MQIYRNDSKFSDRSVLANSADPDQTAPTEDDERLEILELYRRGIVLSM